MGKKNPDMKDNQGKFQPNSSNFENEKMSKLPFFLIINKFQWVTKHIEFFFGNFHIWYIASHMWLVSTLAISQNWQEVA
jgi:hypothetical protein